MAKDVFGIVGTTQAGTFRIDSVVAEGGFGVVYRAQHIGFRAPVALKCLKVPDTMTEEQRDKFLEKFREEGELLFRLSSLLPAVVRPLHVDAFTLDGGRFVPFLALEWLEGEGLDVIIRKRTEQKKPPISPEKLVKLLSPVAHALAQAHRFPGPGGLISIIHRDLKPENIFVAQVQGREQVKILDFGIARTQSAATLYAGRMTTEGAIDAFTPGYAAPEQWAPKQLGQTGPWTDVWGLTLSMVEALTGKLAIDGDVAAMMGAALNQSRRPTPRTLGSEVTPLLEAAFERALAVDPRRRTQSIETLWTEMETAIGLPPSLTASDENLGTRGSSLNSEPPPGPGRTGRAAAPTQVSPRSAAPAEISLDLAIVSPSSGRRVVSPGEARAREPELAPAMNKVNLELDRKAPRVQSSHTLADVPDRPSQAPLDIRGKITLPLQLVAVAVLLSLGDFAYTRFTGQIFSLGPIRSVYIAGPLALAGLLLGGYRFVFDSKS